MILRRAERDDIAALTALQRAAYEPLKQRIGVNPLPYAADYGVLVETMEIWIAGPAGKLDAALVLDPKPDHLLIWSVAVAPERKGEGLGSFLLDFAEARAAEIGVSELRLFTNERFTENVAWYQRRGYTIERVEQWPDRRVLHFRRTLGR